jgi:hypothetical protein
MKYRQWLLRWVLGIALFVFWDLYKWIVRGKLLTADSIIGSLVIAAVLAWFSMLPSTAQNIGFLSWVAAAVLGLVAIFSIEKNIQLSPLADAVLTYAAELLPLLVSVGVVLVWLRKKREEGKV